MRGGKREGAGRKPGVPNKINAEKRAEIAAAGITPLDWMLRVLRDPTVDYDRRDRAARDAAPYLHSRLQTTTLQGNADQPITLEVVSGVPRADSD